MSRVENTVKGVNHPLSQAHGHFVVKTNGQGFQDVTRHVLNWLTEIEAESGLLTVFIRHTSASLTIQENADPDVQTDLLCTLDNLAPQGPHYIHDTEGPDDMPAHIKSMLTATSLGIPVASGNLVLGTWQALYIIEHRTHPHSREIALHYLGTFLSDQSL